MRHTDTFVVSCVSVQYTYIHVQ